MKTYPYSLGCHILIMVQRGKMDGQPICYSKNKPGRMSEMNQLILEEKLSPKDGKETNNFSKTLT